MMLMIITWGDLNSYIVYPGLTLPYQVTRLYLINYLDQGYIPKLTVQIRL